MKWYTLSMCPKCKDKLTEQITEGVREEDYKVMHCPNCGSKMELILDGKEKVENAENAIYKIILNGVRIIHGREDNCLKAIMQIGGFDEREALEKLNTEGSVIFEGDLLHTYLGLRKLDEIDYMVGYQVEPRFPYSRNFSQVCPECGEGAGYREIELNEDSVEEGYFCEKCNRWVSWHRIVSRIEKDQTVYHLKASLKGAGDEVKERMTNLLCVKVKDDQIEEEGFASDLCDILGMFKTYNIDYKIDPSYPHKIFEWDK